MQISWLGAASVRIITTPLQEGIVIITDPFDPKALGIKRGKLTADVVTVSNPLQPLHNAVNEVRREGDQAPFVITTPGECELKGAMIYGIAAGAGKGDKTQPCTLFLLESEGINLLHIGALGQSKLTDSQLERFERVDVLIVPIGDPEGLTSTEAVHIVGQIEPRIVIPLSYDKGRGKGAVPSGDKFIKELGLDAEQPVTKLKLAKKDLPAEDTRVVLLTPA